MSTTTLSVTESGREPAFLLSFPSVTAVFCCGVFGTATFSPDAPFQPGTCYRYTVTCDLYIRIIAATASSTITAWI
ncbi:hypothetical protein [Photorhabdus akhurstii]|uniref:hypothetical protein n=1 Tax=Photorhabdus akhurstii TaxID=171438 RepID=UPI003703FC84